MNEYQKYEQRYEHIGWIVINKLLLVNPNIINTITANTMHQPNDSYDSLDLQQQPIRIQSPHQLLHQFYEIKDNQYSPPLVAHSPKQQLRYIGDQPQKSHKNNDPKIRYDDVNCMCSGIQQLNQQVSDEFDNTKKYGNGELLTHNIDRQLTEKQTRDEKMVRSHLHSEQIKHYSSTMTTATFSGSRRRMLTEEQVHQIQQRMREGTLYEDADRQSQRNEPKRQVYSYYEFTDKKIEEQSQYSECSFSEIEQQSPKIVHNPYHQLSSTEKKKKTQKKKSMKKQMHNRNHCIVPLKFKKSGKNSRVIVHNIGMKHLNQEWFKLLNNIHLSVQDQGRATKKSLKGKKG